MKIAIVIWLLLSVGAFAQQQSYEMKAGVRILIDGDQPQACIYGPLKIMEGAEILAGGSICVKGGHGSLHFADFGTGPFMIDDEGYIFPFFVHPQHARTEVRDFANGVH